MKTKKGFVLMKVGIQNIVVAVDDMAEVFNGMIRLNDTGAFLWEKIEKGATKKELVDEMMKEYDVTEQTALSDIENFVKTLTNADILESLD